MINNEPRSLDLLRLQRAIDALTVRVRRLERRPIGPVVEYTYLRPGGENYFRPGGVDQYIRP